MDLTRLVLTSLGKVWLTLTHNWPYLASSAVIATLLRVFVDAEKVSAFLRRHRGAGILAATAAAVATPLCSCGTTAVVLGLVASQMTWAPVVAFMVASPLTSPEGLVYTAGLFGWRFALAHYATSVILGLVGGGVAAFLESRGWLDNQTRVVLRTPAVSPPARVPAGACACSAPAPQAAPTGGCGCPDAAAGKRALGVPVLLRELGRTTRTLGLMFVGFAFIGYVLNGLIPDTWVAALFGGGRIHSVPLAATLGLPFYINAEASLPLIRSLLDGGMSQGSALAFMVAGSGTSIGAIMGALTIARWRVIAVVVTVLWAGAIACGAIFDLVLA
jgi:hypothetical protein